MDKRIIAKPKGIILLGLFFGLIIVFGLSIGFYAKPDIRLFLFLFISFTLYSIYFLVKSFIFLKFEKDFISHGLKSKYKYSQIKKVELYDFKSYWFLFFPMKEECLTIIFEDEKKIMLEDYYYKNLWEIRWVLENKFLKNNTKFNFNFDIDFQCDEITNKTIKIPFFVKLTPYLLFFLLVLLITNLILLYFNVYSNGWLLGLNILGLLILTIFRGKSFYMESCDKGIVIKNLFSKHVNIKISLNQIENIKLEKIIGGRTTTIVLVIHMKYHKDYKFPIDFIKYDRVENIINQVKKLNIDFYDLR